jgi:hypothetical protein
MKFIYKRVFGLCELLDGLISIFTPFYGPLTYNLTYWKAKRDAREWRKKNQ